VAIVQDVIDVTTECDGPKEGRSGHAQVRTDVFRYFSVISMFLLQSKAHTPTYCEWSGGSICRIANMLREPPRLGRYNSELEKRLGHQEQAIACETNRAAEIWAAFFYPPENRESPEYLAGAKRMSAALALMDS
jgi:hypothetical protein